MNKLFYIFLFLTLFCCEAKTQTDYITNGSFEQIDSCYGCAAPIGFDVFEWSGCKGWSNPIKSSSDLWCQNPKICNTIPPYVIGFQYPKTGNNMAGILIGDGNVPVNYKEYIQNKLANTLIKNKTYKISFFINLSSKLTGSCLISDIGIYLSAIKIKDTSSLWLDNLGYTNKNPTNNFISDTLNWQEISFEYKSNGTENYIIIGNFQNVYTNNLSGISCDTTGGGFGGGYFYIDDVSVFELPMNFSIPNVFTPNNDGINDELKISNDGIKKTTIYNRWGNIIFNTEKQNHFWDGRTTSGEPCVDGNYFYIIQTEEKTYKGFVQLVR